MSTTITVEGRRRAEAQVGDVVAYGYRRTQRQRHGRQRRLVGVAARGGAGDGRWEAIWATSTCKYLLSLGHFRLLRWLGYSNISAACTLLELCGGGGAALFTLVELVRRHGRPTGRRRNKEKEEGEEKKRRNKTEGMENVTAMAQFQFCKISIAPNNITNSNGIFLNWQSCNGMDKIKRQSIIRH
uniref:Uncharacterized protein n=1 Tax=Oryza glumipatula TaxID=40148 RepID=A0A0E0B1S3_9ORYZ